MAFTGFLINYADEEAFLSEMPDELYGKIVRACVDYQRSNEGKKESEFKPMPEMGDKFADMVLMVFEHKIKMRFIGQSGGKANVEKNGYAFYNEEWRRISKD